MQHVFNMHALICFSFEAKAIFFSFSQFHICFELS